MNSARPGGSARTRPALSSASLFFAFVIAGCSAGPGTGPSGPPITNNAPPVVSSIVVQGTAGPREPAQYATLGETVNVTAVVTDAETPVAQLTYEWTSSVGGSFGANAATSTWTAPASAATPLNATLTLTVTERFGTNQTHRVTATSVVDLHDSAKEVGDLAVLFLEDFSRQRPVDEVMRNFTSSCPEAAQERDQVEESNQVYEMEDWFVGSATTTVPFTGTCPFRSVRGDACARVPVYWKSRNRSTGVVGSNSGIDQVTALLENGVWKLCASDYDMMTTFGDPGLAFLLSR